jgi:hypothetical protein
MCGITKVCNRSQATKKFEQSHVPLVWTSLPSIPFCLSSVEFLPFASSNKWIWLIKMAKIPPLSQYLYTSGPFAVLLVSWLRGALPQCRDATTLGCAQARSQRWGFLLLVYIFNLRLLKTNIFFLLRGIIVELSWCRIFIQPPLNFFLASSLVVLQLFNGLWTIVNFYNGTHVKLPYIQTIQHSYLM